MFEDIFSYCGWFLRDMLKQTGNKKKSKFRISKNWHIKWEVKIATTKGWAITDTTGFPPASVETHSHDLRTLTGGGKALFLSYQSVVWNPWYRQTHTRTHNFIRFQHYVTSKSWMHWRWSTLGNPYGTACARKTDKQCFSCFWQQLQCFSKPQRGSISLHLSS